MLETRGDVSHTLDLRPTKLGSGTYGQVYLAERVGDPNAKFAVKQVHVNPEDACITPSIFRELVFLSEISCPMIVRLSEQDIALDTVSNTLSFAYEFAAVDVRKVITYYSPKKGGYNTFRLPPVVAKSILFQLLIALEYLHKRHVAHCDVTPSNLLLMAPWAPEGPGRLKLIDFGLSRIIEPTTVPRRYGIVTVWYRAPELLLGDTQYDEKVDIWAAGCVFAELLTGQILFATRKKYVETDPTAYNSDQMRQIVDVLGPIKEDDCPRAYEYIEHVTDPELSTSRGHDLRQRLGIDGAAFDLISRMLVYNPDRRISASEALRHPYFNEVPICVMNITGQIAPAEWSDLERLGRTE